ncbi:hypothetical protein GQ607_014763 [Colletotrichum asianum]|uniref:Peptidase A1 domain-containing protein n=1 Tax=Colletotrichum asianum TaxID=702518 RepID=A0A8H3ZG73_9PEZI|nr:hypothetical protein GQ607_014763 [Colletotrichum asianum]
MRNATHITLLAVAAGTTAQLTLPWTSDTLSANYSIPEPDGPWQAPCVFINGVPTPLWLSGSSATVLLTQDVNGSYTPSTSANKTGKSRGAVDAWFSTYFLSGSFYGSEYYDEVQVRTKLGTSEELDVNSTIVAANKWRSSNADTNAIPDVMPTIGFLGLGPKESPSDDKTVGSILEQLKAAGGIKRSAWSLHMGSAALGLPGSLVLGAYEQNRALGDVGQFAIQRGLPTVFLRDVFIGTEAGAASSFPASPNASFWVEPKGLGADYVKTFGGAQGSAIATPNPVSPYIYLPTGVCEAFAENLGLTYHNGTGLYLWESSRNGSLYDFINSPSYLGFILSDSTATNLTIKVPFKLLNLTLSAPLVEKKVNYFPCKSVDESIAGQWQLGRAFLQAAFLGVDYDSNLMYMAQAPGPGIEQSIAQSFDGSIIKTNPAESFSKSWNNYWTITPLKEDNLVNEDKGMTAGGTAGIVMAAIVGVTVVLWFLRRRRKRRQGPDASSDYIDKAVVWFNVRRGKSRGTTVLSDTSSNADTERGFAMDQKGVNEVNGDYLPPEIGGPEYDAKELDSREKPAEIDSRSRPVEIDSRSRPAEMATPFSHAAGYPRHEMPANPIVYELPGSFDRVGR